MLPLSRRHTIRHGWRLRGDWRVRSPSKILGGGGQCEDPSPQYFEK